MNPERWERVKQLFDEALELGGAARASMLDGACSDDGELRSQVEELLAEYQRADTAFLRTASGERSRQTAVETERIGTLLSGRYRIQRELGRGGSGVVYLAQDELLLGRPSVVKFLHQRAEQHPALRARFRHEMEALARIRHPGVVTLLDAGELAGGERYIVMEFIEGGTLRAELESGALGLDRVARLVEQICSALSAAHQQGILHRDLKPENIMLLHAGTADETVKLIDFGIAKVEQSQAQNHTETWTFMGTVNYVSPEHLLGRDGIGTDVWALGVVCYEMVTGRRPFQPKTPFHLYELQRAQRIIDPCRLCRGLPSAAGAAILRALSFEVPDRQATPARFAAEFCGAARVNRNPWRTLRRHPRLAVAGALLTVVAAAVAWSWQASSAGNDGIPATDLSINTPLGVAVDRRGNVYFTEYANNRAWRVNAAGRATVLAGTGIAGFSGNGGPAANAIIQAPRNLVLDGDRSIYMVETTTDRVRRIDLGTGIIEHVLGNGQPRFDGDGKPGTETGFSEGLGLAIDRQGDLIFADTNNFRIRRLPRSGGPVTTIAGTGTRGYSGDGGPALQAQLGRTSGLALAPNGDLFLFDVDSQLIRRIRQGVITTVAGSESATALEGAALEVRLGSSTGMSLDPAAGNLYFTEESRDTLRQLNLASGRISIVAGNRTQGSSGDGGPALQASLANPTGVAIDEAGNIYVAEATGNRIRRVTRQGIISTYAGGKVQYAPMAGTRFGPLLFASR